MDSRSLERRTGHVQLGGGIEIAGAQDGKEDVLAPQVIRTQHRGFLARVLQDAPNLRRGRERCLTDREVSKTPMGGLPADPEIPRDGCERGAVRQRVRDLAALECIELSTELAEGTQRRTRRRGACRVSRKTSEALTGDQAPPIRRVTAELI
jgi:hypothetical protein